MNNNIKKDITAVFITLVVYAVFVWGMIQIAGYFPANHSAGEIVYENHE